MPFKYNLAHLTHQRTPDGDIVPQRRWSLLALAAVLVALAAALVIRIAWPWDHVMLPGAVWFRGMDAYYHMRLVDNLVANFPHLTAWDPFTFYPRGIEPPFHPLTGWLIAVSALLAGGGAPSAELIDKVGAFYPAILGALIVVPVYFLGWGLFGRVAGATAAIMIAIMPGEYLSRTLLGFADHHATEAFFSTCALLFLVLATRAAVSRGITLGSLKQSYVAGERRTFVLIALAGVSLGLYLLAWRGSALILLVLFVYTAIRAIADYARNVETDDVIIVCSPAVIIGGLMVVPIVLHTWTPALFVAALLAAAFSPVALRYVSRFARAHGWRTLLFAGVLVAAALVVVAIVGVVAPSAVRNAMSAIDFLIPTGEGLSIQEMHPLFFPSGEFSLRPPWTNFVTVLPVAIVALVLLLRARRRLDNHAVLFLVWSIVMLAAVLLQRRFGYYFAICAALLTAYLVARLYASGWVQRRVDAVTRTVRAPTGAQKKSDRRAMKARQSEKRSSAFALGALAAVLVLVLVVPSVDMSRNFATEAALMTTGWAEALDWLHDNTDDPMGADAYYALYDAPAPGEAFDYPDTAYSVMAWWDFGHWLTRVARRIPVCNPFQQGARTAARFFVSDDETEAREYLDSLDCRYVIVDAKTAVTSFHGVALFGGEQPDDYFQVYTQQTTSGTTEPILLYYPSYYQTMMARLFAFSAKVAEPEEYQVIRYRIADGHSSDERTITALERFDTYEEALAYIDESEDPNISLVSTSPFTTCVPVEAMDGYTLVFESRARTEIFGKLVPEVRIFEYSGA